MVDKTQEYYPTIYTYIVDFIPQHTSYDLVSKPVMNPLVNKQDMETLTELPRTKNNDETELNYDSTSGSETIIETDTNNEDNISDLNDTDDVNNIENDKKINQKEFFVNTDEPDETISPLKILENVTLSVKDVSNSLAEKLPNIINMQNDANENENENTNEDQNPKEDETNSKIITAEINN